ncbi:25234_t:CDS:2, partial [Gigaspora margarita]
QNHSEKANEFSLVSTTQVKHNEFIIYEPYTTIDYDDTKSESIDNSEDSEVIQKCYLENKFPEINIYSKDFYNAIRHYKTPAASNINQDASLLLEYLISKQHEDSDWKVNIYFEGVDTSLARLFWQTPTLACQRLQISQSCLYRLYKINYPVSSQSRVLLSSMLKLVNNETICKIWHIRLFSTPTSHNEQYIIVLDDGTHLCSFTIQFTHNIVDVQEIQNDESNSNFDIIKQLQGPDCIGIAKIGIQIALDTNTMNEFISMIHSFIESKSIQADNSLELDNIRSVTNPHIIAHHDQSKKQIQDSLNDVDQLDSQKIHNKVLHESDITNKLPQKCSYCNNTGHYAKTCKLYPKNKYQM